MQKSELIEQIHAIKESNILQYEVLHQLAVEDAILIKDKQAKADKKLEALSYLQKADGEKRFLKILDKINKK